MEYDPIKRRLGSIFNKNKWLRRLFYTLLDWLLLRSWHVRKVLKKLRRSIGSRKLTILDAGSGFGQYSYRMCRIFKNATITGVDIKPEQIEDCNRFAKGMGLNHQLSFEYADLTSFCQPERYDLILSVDVMEHIEEDESVFGNFYSSLKAGGYLVISTPSDQGGSDSDHHQEGEVHGFIDEHVRDGYGVHDIRTKLMNAGFQKVDVKYTYGIPGSLSWKISMKYPITLLGISPLFYLLLPIYYLVLFPFCIVFNFWDLYGIHSSGTGLLVVAEK